MTVMTTRYTASVRPIRRTRCSAPGARSRRPAAPLRMRGDLQDGVHPAQVVTVQVAEEDVATGSERQGKRPDRPRGDVVELSHPIQPVLVHAQPVGTEGESIRGKVRPDDHELVRGGRVVVDLQDDVTYGHGGCCGIDVEVPQRDVHDLAFRLRCSGTRGWCEQSEAAYGEAEADPLSDVPVHSELHA